MMNLLKLVLPRKVGARLLSTVSHPDSNLPLVKRLCHLAKAPLLFRNQSLRLLPTLQRGRGMQASLARIIVEAAAVTVDSILIRGHEHLLIVFSFVWR